MEQLLAMLKVDLGISTTAYDTRLTQYINSAKEMIGTEGVTLNTTDLEDAQRYCVREQTLITDGKPRPFS